MKNHIGWWIAALATIVSIGLGVALYRADQTAKKQDVTIAYLRAEQAKIGQLSDQSRRKLAADVSRLEQELESAQRAQRELTEQSFEYENEIDFLNYELETAEDIAAESASPPEVPETPYPTYLALKRAVLSGNPYRSEWEAMQNYPLKLNDEEALYLTIHADEGLITRDALRKELRDIYEVTSAPPEPTGFMRYLKNIITIRKIDKGSLGKPVADGNIDKAARILREISGEAENDMTPWLGMYDRRKEVLNTLDTIEKQLEAEHG